MNYTYLKDARFRRQVGKPRINRAIIGCNRIFPCAWHNLQECNTWLIINFQHSFILLLRPSWLKITILWKSPAYFSYTSVLSLPTSTCFSTHFTYKNSSCPVSSFYIDEKVKYSTHQLIPTTLYKDFYDREIFEDQ